jgi:hypothetical protein
MRAFRAESQTVEVDLVLFDELFPSARSLPAEATFHASQNAVSGPLAGFTYRQVDFRMAHYRKIACGANG